MLGWVEVELGLWHYKKSVFFSYILCLIGLDLSGLVIWAFFVQLLFLLEGSFLLSRSFLLGLRFCWIFCTSVFLFISTNLRVSFFVSVSELLCVSLIGSCLVVWMKMLVSPSDIVTVVLLPDTSGVGDIISGKLSVMLSGAISLFSVKNLARFFTCDVWAN